SRSENAALLVRAVRMTERGHEHAIRVARIDDDVRDLLGVAQTEMRPRLAAVGGSVDAVADRQVGTRDAFAAADVHDAGIGRRHPNRADRSGRLLVEDRPPRPAEIVRLPDAAVDEAGIEDARLARHADDRLRPPPAQRPDVAPAQLAEELSIVRLRR